MKTLVIKPNYSEMAAGALCLSQTALLQVLCCLLAQGIHTQGGALGQQAPRMLSAELTR